MPDCHAVKSRLASYHDDQVIGADELAAMLNTSAGMVYRLCAIREESLPPRLRTFGRKLAWRLGTCRDWLRQQDTGAKSRCEPDSSPRRPGRRRQPAHAS